MNLSECIVQKLTIPEFMYLFFPHKDLLFIATVVTSSIATFTIVANVTMIVALVRAILRDVKSIRADNNVITRILMTSLAFSDTMTGTIIMTFGILELSNNGKWTLGGRLCSFRLAMNNLLCSVSVYHVLCMAVDRYLAVCWPMTYRLLTSRHASLMVLLTWGFPALLIVLPEATGLHHMGVEDLVHCSDINHLCGTIYNPTALFLIFPFAFYLPLILTYILYVMILIEIKQFHKRDPRNVVSGANKMKISFACSIKERADLSIEAKASTSTSTDSSSSTISYRTTQSELFLETSDLKVTSDRGFQNDFHVKPQDGAVSTETVLQDSIRKSAPSKKIKRNLKAYRTIGCVVLCCTLCWVPTWIVVLLFIYDVHFMPIIGVICLLWLAYSNAGLNPVIYCLNKSVRRALRSMLR